MDQMTCPSCQGVMAERTFAGTSLAQCGECQALLLPRASLGVLSEAESDWHAHRSAHTAPLPRITADMTAPPQAPAASRSFLEMLFRDLR